MTERTIAIAWDVGAEGRGAIVVCEETAVGLLRVLLHIPLLQGQPASGVFKIPPKVKAALDARDET